MKPNWFVALPLNADGWLAELLADLPASCRRLHHQDLHLTLAFLGSMASKHQADVEQVMAEIDFPCFELSFDRLIALPNSKRPSAFALDVATGRRQAVDLMIAFRDELWDAARARRDSRPPLPHATVARPNRRQGDLAVQAGLQWLGKKHVPDIRVRVDQVALYTWHEDRPQRQFKVVTAFDLPTS